MEKPKAIVFSESPDYFPKELRKKFKVGEYSDADFKYLKQMAKTSRKVKKMAKKTK